MRDSLRLLPSGPDRFGEALARANLSGAQIGWSRGGCKPCACLTATGASRETVLVQSHALQPVWFGQGTVQRGGRGLEQDGGAGLGREGPVGPGRNADPPQLSDIAAQNVQSQRVTVQDHPVARDQRTEQPAACQPIRVRGQHEGLVVRDGPGLPGQVADAVGIRVGKPPVGVKPRRGGQVDPPADPVDDIEVVGRKLGVQQRRVARAGLDAVKQAGRTFQPSPQLRARQADGGDPVRKGVEVGQVPQAQRARRDVGVMLRSAPPPAR